MLSIPSLIQLGSEHVVIQRSSENLSLDLLSSMPSFKRDVCMDPLVGIFNTSSMKQIFVFVSDSLRSILISTQTRHHLMLSITSQLSATMVAV